MRAGSCLLSTTASRSYLKNGVFEDLKMIDVPVLVMQGEDDQICPFASSGAKSVKLLKYGTLKTYPGFPHGMPTTNADRINADILEFVTASEVTDTSASARSIARTTARALLTDSSNSFPGWSRGRCRLRPGCDSSCLAGVRCGWAHPSSSQSHESLDSQKELHLAS